MRVRKAGPRSNCRRSRTPHDSPAALLNVAATRKTGRSKLPTRVQTSCRLRPGVAECQPLGTGALETRDAWNVTARAAVVGHAVAVVVRSIADLAHRDAWLATRRGSTSGGG